MEVVLKLKRARTWGELAAFDVHRDVPAHCAEAAVALFAADVLALAEADGEADSVLAVGKLTDMCLRPDAFMWTKLQGGLQCTLRTAVFTALLAHMPVVAPDAAVMAWAARRGLRGNVGSLPWSITDLMYALQSVVVHWERVCAKVWERTAEKTHLDAYLRFLWSQCAYFVVRCATPLDGGSKHTMPYTAETAGADHEVSVSPSTVAEMCAVWRALEHQRRWTWSLAGYVRDSNAPATFLRVFAFEKAQLSVPTFREQLRVRLATRFLLVGDAETWRAAQGGKPLDVDLALGAQGARNMPGFVQEAALNWDWKKIHTHPAVRDEVYRMMADTAFRSRAGGVDFSSRFFEQDADRLEVLAPRRSVWLVVRVLHGFAVVWCDARARREARTPPLPFADAFVQWARRVATAAHARVRYGEEVQHIAQSCQR